jgi:drug/metabolite transporter (DMT)-like permease
MSLLSSWIVLSIIAGLASNGFNFISRYLLKEQEDSTAYAWFFEIVRLFCFATIAIFDWQLVITPLSLFLFLLLGLTEWIGVYWYMKMHQSTHLSISAILTRTRLIWIPVIAFFLINERLQISDYLGIIILFAGLCTVVSPKKIIFDKGANYANLSAFMIALNTVLTKMALPYGSNSLINIAITLLPALFFPIMMKNRLPRMKKVFKGKLRIKLLAVGVNLISVYAFIAALRLGDSGKVNAIYQGMLVTSIIAGILFLNERNDLRKKIIGTIITIIGVIILSIY